MYKVLLVDDEPMIMLSLQGAIDWQEHGYELSGFCANGEEALAFISQNAIDIIITDLRMPKMNGIELIEALRAQGFPGAILVLSNYSDFELVRQALTAGALDYQLKIDMDGDVLLRQLAKAASVVDETRQHQISEEEKEQHSSVIRSQLTEDYLIGAKEVTRQQLDFVRSTSGYCEYQQVIYVSLASSGEVNVGVSKLEHAARLIQSLMNKDMAAECYVTPELDVVVLLYLSDMQKDYNIHEVCGKIRRNLSLYFGLTSMVLLPSPSEGLEESRERVSLCKHARQISFYKHAALLIPEKVSFSEMPEHLSLDEIAQETLIYGRLQQPGHIPRKLSCLLETMRETHVFPQEAQAFLSRFLLREIEMADIPMEEVNDTPIRTATHQQAIEQFITRHNEIIARSADGDRFSEAQIVIRYMKENMANAITLDELAHMMNLNRSYLSRLFKQQTGTNIFACLTELRLQRAARLLRSGVYYVREVAEQVGYADQLYFTKLFHKRFGESPKEYMRKERQE